MRRISRSVLSLHRPVGSEHASQGQAKPTRALHYQQLRNELDRRAKEEGKPKTISRPATVS